MSETNNKPVRIFRRRGVKVSVFQNLAQENVFHKLTLQKIYRQGEEWKTTSSLGRDDIPIARLLLGQAWEYILTQESSPHPEETAQDAD